jgi:WD40 repeat protein
VRWSPLSPLPLCARPTQVESLRYDRRGRLLASYNGGVSLWDLTRPADAKRELALPYPGACLCADATPDGAYIVAGCHDSTVHIFHLAGQRDGGVELQVGARLPRRSRQGALWTVLQPRERPVLCRYLRAAWLQQCPEVAPCQRPPSGPACPARPLPRRAAQEMTCGGYDSKVTAVDFNPRGDRMASAGGLCGHQHHPERLGVLRLCFYVGLGLGP